MATYDDLDVGSRFTTPVRQVTSQEAEQLITLSGFVHPLFTDPTFAAERTPFPASPLPGQLVLAIAGGLMEQCGRIDESVVGLGGLDHVRFMAPVLPGDQVAVEAEVVDKHLSSSGARGILTFALTCLAGGRKAATWNATFIFAVRGD